MGRILLEKLLFTYHSKSNFIYAHGHWKTEVNKWGFRYVYKTTSPTIHRHQKRKVNILKIIRTSAEWQQTVYQIKQWISWT